MTSIENVTINVTVTINAQESTKQMRGHKSPTLEAAKTKPKAQQCAFQRLDFKLRLADKIRTLFGDEAATAFLAGGV